MKRRPSASIRQDGGRTCRRDQDGNLQERAAPEDLIQMSCYSSKDLSLSITIEVLVD